MAVPYFTMKEIRGRTMLDVIEEVHVASTEGWRPAESGWTFVRLVTAFHAVCESVAYAHSRGVLHRDLKPTNVMLGEFGEVVVMDWGLAKVAGVPDVKSPQVVTTRSWGNLYETQHGSIAGTPNYMAPEQARGEARQVGPWTDVYSLGALLYEILADRAPFGGETHEAVMQELLRGPPPPPYPPFHRSTGQATPEDGLRAICDKAMSRDLSDRYVDAGHLARAVAGWLDNASAHERAVTLVQRADNLEPELLDLRKQSATLRADAASMLARLPADAGATEKREAWSLEDEAVELEQAFQRTQGRYVELLRAALEVVPDLPQAHARLRGIDDLTGAHGARSKVGEGWLTLLTEPSGALVELRRIDSVERRLVDVPFSVGKANLRTPLRGLALPVGTYQLTLSAPGHAPLRVLARVERGELWSTIPAGTTKPRVIRLPREGEDPPGTVRIPLGWSWFGGDIEAADTLPRSRAWVEAFLIQRHPVTNRAYLTFLRDLLALDRPRHVRAYAPGGWASAQGAVALPQSEHPDWPVRRVTFDGAQAFARWYSAQTGQRWRLPREREWERAARGLDERLFPWGNHLEPSWACVGTSHEGRPPSLAPVDAFPQDASPWGVRGLGGNVRDWVIGDGAPRTGPVPPEFRWVRGGHAYGIPQFARSALRYRLPTHADKGVGFRMVRPIRESLSTPPPTATVQSLPTHNSEADGH